MSAHRDEILAFLDAELETHRYRDYAPIGMQVIGAERVERVASAVSSTLEVFDRASVEGAQMLLVHHGMFWDNEPRAIGAHMRRRLERLFAADITLAAYHLPLDGHQEHGNNALLAAALGANGHAPAFPYKGAEIGVVARFEGDGIPAAELTQRVRALTRREPLVFAAGPARIRTLGIVSGAAAGTLAEAIELGLDAFLTGEPKEHVMAQAREAGIHFLAAGHYATETLGIRRLGELVAERFDLVHTFVEIPNPV
jgi:dinuclear metal center YbgI/SA1388 family protein